ncbi:MAG: dihydrolipoyllysine-residue acetyltransferase [Gammaproteobacteria bacterium]|jgi:pyruvate dehydrogenase E2 component (dihydrolipoamide acetyltransferase)|nr:dihydrolipoyllysine-residue acetyltransferase [Gammaproteobacteria bacterium]
MSTEREILLPDIGDFDSVEVIDIAVKPGDKVNIEDTLITLESDKATMDIPSPAVGIVKEIKLSVGDQVNEKALILILTESGDAEKPDEVLPSSDETPTKKTAAVEEKSNIQEQEVVVPDIGDFESVEVIDVVVKAGDEVEMESTLITVESDKATMDIPSPAVGKVKQVNVKNGDKIAQGSSILILETSKTETAASPAKSDKQKPVKSVVPEEKAAEAAKIQPPQAPATPTSSETVGSSQSAKAHASPAIRKFARELGVDLGLVRGSGTKGRILKDDVKSFTKAVMSSERVFEKSGGFSLPEIPPVDFSKFGPVETLPLSRLKRLGGQNLHRSWINVPHVTQFDEADISELESFRKSKSDAAAKEGVKLTPLTFFIKAVVVALKKYPNFNASLSPDGENLIMKNYFHIGIAVNTDQGLMVPVVRDADQKGIYDLARELAELAQKARDKKLSPSQMQGGCFTISSLGHIGGTGFTPIVNTPEVAILGISRSTMKPVYENGEFVPRLILPFSLSYDHRVIDGVAAAEFTRYLGAVLSDIRDILL